MWLYSAQGLEKPKYKESTAEKAGLSAHLGYRPLFCSYVNPDSLSDTWFRIWSAAPGRVDELWLMEVDDSEVITLDSLLWTNGYLSGEKKDFDKVLNTPFCESTDLLIKPDTQPKQIYKFPFLDIINGTYDDWDIANEEKVVWLFITQQIREFQQSSRIYGTDDNFVSSDPSSVTCEQWYGLATYTGLIAYIWAIATGRREKRFNKFLSQQNDILYANYIELGDFPTFENRMVINRETTIVNDVEFIGKELESVSISDNFIYFHGPIQKTYLYGLIKKRKNACLYLPSLSNKLVVYKILGIKDVQYLAKP